VSIEYTTDIADVEPGHLTGFFERWPTPPSPERHLQILRGSYRVVLAREQGDPQVVGFVNALSDGTLYAFVPLLEVLPSHRHHGIGSELVRRMLTELAGFYAIDLVCDEELASFYERFGMKRATGMVLRRYEAAAG
jgi:ribosomal protein S18 acetylase RimI-like enzyme